MRPLRIAGLIALAAAVTATALAGAVLAAMRAGAIRGPVCGVDDPDEWIYGLSDA
jgi:hypothetical protein